MKLAGLLLIILVCTGAGMMKSMEYTARVRQIEAILSVIHTIATEMRYRAATISQMISGIAKREEFKCLPFLADCDQSCRQGMEFPAAWAEAVQGRAKSMGLKDREQKLLLSFGCGIGTTDVEGQLANCTLHQELFEQSLLTAREEKEKQGKLYSRLGVLSGVGAAILLI